MPAGTQEAFWKLSDCVFSPARVRVGRGLFAAVILRAEPSWAWDHLHGALGCQGALQALPVYSRT